MRYSVQICILKIPLLIHVGNINASNILGKKPVYWESETTAGVVHYVLGADLVKS